MKYLILVSSLIMPATAYSVDVKGLELGKVTSFQALANNFGNAVCPKDELNNSNLNGEFDCTVPISYLGVKTNANITLEKNWRVLQIQIEMPTDLLPQVEKVITKNYGKPDVVRGNVEVIQIRNVGETQSRPVSISDPCSRWNKLNEVHIRVCEYRDRGFIKSEPSSLTYKYRAPKVLDETDL